MRSCLPVGEGLGHVILQEEDEVMSSWRRRSSCHPAGGGLDGNVLLEEEDWVMPGWSHTEPCL